MLSPEVITQLNNPLYFMELAQESGNLCVCILCACDTSYRYNSSGILEAHSKGPVWLKSVHCFLYRYVLCGYKKALPALSSWAVLCMPSRISNSFSVWVVIESDAFGPWWGFSCLFCFRWLFFFWHLINSRTLKSIKQLKFSILLCAAIEPVCYT